MTITISPTVLAGIDLSTLGDRRILVLIDQRIPRLLRRDVVCSYDHEPDPHLANELFDQTFARCSSGRFTDILDEKDLPILRGIGRHQITLVIKNLDNTVTLRDGLSADVSSSMGLEAQ